jgi:hypothetical protein
LENSGLQSNAFVTKTTAKRGRKRKENGCEFVARERLATNRT